MSPSGNIPADVLGRPCLVYLCARGERTGSVFLNDTWYWGIVETRNVYF